MRCEFSVWTYARIRVQITMASISVGWAWPSQTLGWNINAGLESSTRLNFSAYVRAHTRVELYAGSMNGSAYARVYARTKYESSFSGPWCRPGLCLSPVDSLRKDQPVTRSFDVYFISSSVNEHLNKTVELWVLWHYMTLLAWPYCNIHLSV